MAHYAPLGIALSKNEAFIGLGLGTSVIVSQMHNLSFVCRSRRAQTCIGQAPVFSKIINLSWSVHLITLSLTRTKSHFFDLTSQARGVCPPHDHTSIQSKCTVARVQFSIVGILAWGHPPRGCQDCTVNTTVPCKVPNSQIQMTFGSDKWLYFWKGLDYGRCYL